MSTFKNWTDYQQRLNLIFHAIVAVTMLPFVWLYLEIDTERRTGALDDPIILILFLLVCVSLGGTSFLYKKKQFETFGSITTLREKLISYQRVMVVAYALLEGAAVFATLAFYLTANYLFVLVYIFVLFGFSLGRPSIDRICRELKLPNADKEILLNRDVID
jgi:DMSO reductase anchor subunit